MPRIFKIPEDVPLVGTVYFGIIDRGTNVLQIRPSTSCPLNCIFCSTDAGPKSKNRQAEYIVDLNALIDWTREIVKIKGMGVEAHIDTVGDPLTYPWLIDLVQSLREIREISVISIQTHGYLLNERIVEELEAAGLSRVNLSIDALDVELARKLSGSDYYDVKKIMEIAEYIAKSTSMDLLIAPVWVHPLNDGEMEKIIEFAKRIGAGKRWPALGIQKCEFHKFGRRTKEMKYMTWYEFYNRLREMEKKTKMKLVLKPSDFGIEPRRRLKAEFKKGEKVKVKVIGPGWLKGEKLAMTRNGRWSLTVIGEVEEEDVVVKLIRVKDNILIGVPI